MLVYKWGRFRTKSCPVLGPLRANSSAAPAPLLGPPGPTPGVGLAKCSSEQTWLCSDAGAPGLVPFIRCRAIGLDADW